MTAETAITRTALQEIFGTFGFPGLFLLLGAISLTVVSVVVAVQLVRVPRGLWMQNNAILQSLGELPALLRQAHEDHTHLDRHVEDLTDVSRSIHTELRALSENIHRSDMETKRELLELARERLRRRNPGAETQSDD